MRKKDIIQIVLIVAICAILIITKPIMIAIVSGSSMEPTLVDKDVLLMYKYRKPKRGDIIVVKSPESWKNNDKLLIKRVVAVPGDNLEIMNGQIFVNDRLVMNIEPFYSSVKELHITLNDSYFIKGDNTGNSVDSLFHYYIGDDSFLVNKKYVKYSRNGGDYDWGKKN